MQKKTKERKKLVSIVLGDFLSLSLNTVALVLLEWAKSFLLTVLLPNKLFSGN